MSVLGLATRMPSAVIGRVLSDLAAVAQMARFAPDPARMPEVSVQLAPLKVPAGLDTPNTQGALVIPAQEVTPPPQAANAACLDTPPRYKPASPSKSATG